MKVNPYSYLKIFQHPEKLNSLKQRKVSAPLYVRMKPINLCNHHCFYCSYDDQDLGLRSTFKVKDKIPWPKMEETLNDFGDIGVKAITFSGGGEPLIYPHIEESMELVLKLGIDLSIITHGELIKDRRAELLSKAKWVRISMDSCKAETYSKIRSLKDKSFYTVSENMKNFKKIKESYCELGVNFVIHHLNYDQIYDMAKYVKDLGANHIKYAARITDDLFTYHESFKQEAIEQLHRVMTELADDQFKVINKYEDDFKLAMVYERKYTRCPIIQAITVVGADSKAFIFINDKAYVPGGDLGSLENQSFKDLWFSEETQNFFDNFNPMESCKHHCTYDERNMLINSFLNLEERHVNFV